MCGLRVSFVLQVYIENRASAAAYPRSVASPYTHTPSHGLSTPTCTHDAYTHPRPLSLASHRLRVELNYVKRFRYCDYLGKHFCPSCHQKGTAVIPARVIIHWDFKRYPVSNFAAELLSSLYSDPLYDLSTLNPSLVCLLGRLPVPLADACLISLREGIQRTALAVFASSIYK